MSFKRVWDSSCPREWDRWESDGATWVIRDLPPEDDEEAVDLLVDHLIPDETLCIASGLVSDPLSLKSMREFWRFYISKRMSLACYEEKNGASKLVAVNCLVLCKHDQIEEIPIEGAAWINVYGAMKVVEEKGDAYKLLGVDRLLYGLGLVVNREYRGKQLGSKLLAARNPLSLYHGIKASSTVFSGIASQISAARAGFTTAAEVTFRELHECGLNYSPEVNKSIKLMVKKFE